MKFKYGFKWHILDISTRPAGNALPLEVFYVHEQQSGASAAQQAVEVEAEEVAIGEEEAQSEEDNEGLAAFPSSQDRNPQSAPVEMTAVPPSPTFPFT